MKKRIFLLAALAAGLVLCLAACGETNGEPVTVTLWHVYGRPAKKSQVEISRQCSL